MHAFAAASWLSTAADASQGQRASLRQGQRSGGPVSAGSHRGEFDPVGDAILETTLAPVAS